MAYPGFGSGFAQGLGGALAQLPQLLAYAQQREDQKQLLDLQKKKLVIEDQLATAQVNAIAKSPGMLQSIMTGVGIAVPGGEAVPTEASVSPTPSSPLRNALVAAPPSGAPAPDSSAAAPVVPQPQGVAGVTEQQQQSMPGGAGRMRLEGFSYNPMKPWEMNFKVGNEPMKSNVQAVTVENGQQQYMNIITNGQGQVVKTAPIQGFRPNPPEAIQAAEAAVRSFGAPEGAVSGLAGQWLAAKELPNPDQRTAALLSVQKQAQQYGQISKSPEVAGAATSPQYDIVAPDLGQAVTKGNEMAAQAAAQKTGAETTARLKSGPVPEQDKQAVYNLQKTADAIDLLNKDFTPEERKKFVGVLQQPLKKIAQLAEADPRFARFQAIMGQVKQYAFQEGGKTLTPTELAVVQQYVPQGNELSATDFEAKITAAQDQIRGLIDRRRELAGQTVEEFSKGGSKAARPAEFRPKVLRIVPQPSR